MVWPRKTIGDFRSKVIALDLPLARRKLPSWERQFLTMEPRKGNLETHFWRHQGNSSCMQTFGCSLLTCSYGLPRNRLSQDRRPEARTQSHTQTDFVTTILCPSKGSFVHPSLFFMKSVSKLEASFVRVCLLSFLRYPCAHNKCICLAFLCLSAVG